MQFGVGCLQCFSSAYCAPRHRPLAEPNVAALVGSDFRFGRETLRKSLGQASYSNVEVPSLVSLHSGSPYMRA